MEDSSCKLRDIVDEQHDRNRAFLHVNLHFRR